MYRLLIVDDDPVLCEAMVGRVQRLNDANHLDIGPVDRVYSVRQALDYGGEHWPDIVITDIKMPRQSGIDLITEITRRPNNATQVIALSGYHNYNYVRDAFSYGAVDYLLKPVKPELLLQILQKCIDNLCRVQQRTWTDRERRRLEYDVELGKYLNRMVDSTAHTRPAVPSAVAGIMPVGYWHLAALSGDIAPTVFQLISSYLSANCMGAVGSVHHFQDTDQHNILLFVREKPIGTAEAITSLRAQWEREIVDFLEKIVDGLRRERYNCRFGLSLSMMVETPEDVYPDLRRQALFALSCQLLEDFTVRVYRDSGDSSAAQEEADSRYIRKIRNAFQTGSYDIIYNLITNVFTRDFFVDSRPDRIRRFFDYHMINCQELAFSLGLALEPRCFTHFSSLDALRIYLKELLYLLQQRGEDMANQYDEAVNYTIKFIENHYMESMNMNTIAQNVNLSYNYFSRLFKEQTGKSFSEYATEVRMRKACELLEQPQHKIKDIFYLVGYENVYSFSRAFKLYYGVSPNDYRRQKSI